MRTFPADDIDDIDDVVDDEDDVHADDGFGCLTQHLLYSVKYHNENNSKIDVEEDGGNESVVMTMHCSL